MGCEKISDGCKHCYAEFFLTKRRGLPIWGPKAARPATKTRKDLFKWDRAAAAAGVRHKVFLMSMADTFEDREDLKPLRAELFRDVEACTNLDFLILTKRTDRMVPLAVEAGWAGEWPRNVWAGTTVESNKVLSRIETLRAVPARVRFLSVEPLLEGLTLTASMLEGIHWVIVGGESGHLARPFDVQWARDIQRVCQEAGVAFFFKQLGVKPVDSRTIEIVGPEGRVRYRRPADHADVYEAKKAQGYTVRPLPIKVHDAHGAMRSDWPEPFPQTFPTVV